MLGLVAAGLVNPDQAQQNILVTPQGHVTFVDSDAIRTVEEAAVMCTGATSSVLGTPFLALLVSMLDGVFMSPGQDAGTSAAACAALTCLFQSSYHYSVL